MNFTYYGQRPPQPLTLFWKLVITLAAVVGVSTCAVLGLIYVHFFVGTPATVDVLERQLTKQDAIPAIQDEEGDAKIGEARFLASYEDISYYAAPGMISGVACLVGKSPWDDYWSYWEACSEIRDGRDVLVQVQDPDSRGSCSFPTSSTIARWNGRAGSPCTATCRASRRLPLGSSASGRAGGIRDSALADMKKVRRTAPPVHPAAASTAAPTLQAASAPPGSSVRARQAANARGAAIAAARAGIIQ